MSGSEQSLTCCYSIIDYTYLIFIYLFFHSDWRLCLQEIDKDVDNFAKSKTLDQICLKIKSNLPWAKYFLRYPDRQKDRQNKHESIISVLDVINVEEPEMGF